MTIRHKAWKEPLDIGLASEWNDDHWADFTDELLNVWLFPSHVLPADFTTDVSGTASIDTEMSSNHNWLDMETGATGSSVASLRLGDTDTTNKLDLPVATFAINAEDVDLAEFGLFTFANTPFTANQKGIYFRMKTGKVYAVTGDGADETETEIGNYDQFSQYMLVVSSTNVKFYTEDLSTLRATHTTNIPTDDLTLKVSIKNQTADNRILKSDGISLMRLRVK